MINIQSVQINDCKKFSNEELQVLGDLGFRELSRDELMYFAFTSAHADRDCGDSFFNAICNHVGELLDQKQTELIDRWITYMADYFYDDLHMKEAFSL